MVSCGGGMAAGFVGWEDGHAGGVVTDAATDLYPPGWERMSEVEKRRAKPLYDLTFTASDHDQTATEMIDECLDKYALHYGWDGRVPRLTAKIRAWRDADGGRVHRLAREVWDAAAQVDFVLGIARLADALEEAGCTDAKMIGHLRNDWHFRGCWVLELLARDYKPRRRKAGGNG